MPAVSCKAEQQRAEVLEVGLANSSAPMPKVLGEEQEVMDFGHAFTW